jgi:HEAT repeat protein
MRMRNEKILNLKVLGLSARATWQEVQNRYRQLALSLHPDRNSSIGATRRFQQVTAAYEQLVSWHRQEQAHSNERFSQIYDDPKVRRLPMNELTIRLRYSSCPEVRSAVTRLLGSMQGGECRRLLLEAFRDTDAEVRRMALESLGKIGRLIDMLRCLPMIDGTLVKDYLSSLWRVCTRRLRVLLDRSRLLAPAGMQPQR